MKRKLLTAICLLFLHVSYGQNTGIGINAPDEILQVDSTIHIGKNAVIAPGSSRKNVIRFGDGSYVTVGEQDKDDRLVLRAGSFAFRNGNVGVGVDSAAEKLDVAGGARLGYSNGNNPGTIRYNAVPDDIEIRDNTAWRSIQNKYYVQTVYNLEDSNRNILVDLPTTDITVPQTGTYMINYFVDAYNTFNLYGSTSAEIEDRTVFSTTVYVFNKVANIEYQKQAIDFLDFVGDFSGAAYFTASKLPPHCVSGVTVQSLNANDKIGIKMKQVTESQGFGKMRVRICTITLIRLY